MTFWVVFLAVQPVWYVGVAAALRVGTDLLWGRLAIGLGTQRHSHPCPISYSPQSSDGSVPVRVTLSN